MELTCSWVQAGSAGHSLETGCDTVMAEPPKDSASTSGSSPEIDDRASCSPDMASTHMGSNPSGSDVGMGEHGISLMTTSYQNHI